MTQKVALTMCFCNISYFCFLANPRTVLCWDQQVCSGGEEEGLPLTATHQQLVDLLPSPEISTFLLSSSFRFFASELLVFAEGGFLYIFFSLSEIIFSGGILLVCRKQGCGALEHAGGTTSGPRKFVANGKRVTSIYSNGERRTLRWQGFVVATDLLFVSFCCLLMLHTFNNLSEGNNGNSTDNGEG